MDDYLEVNKESWNARLDSHVTSDFYDMESFLSGKSSLNAIELELLGDVTGKKILHLQCHFGQDSISLARLGAEVVGVDLSDKAIDKATELAEVTKTNARFVCSDVYNLPNVLEGEFDIVFTSYGTITWLPDLTKWAHVIQHFLKPGGKFVFAEFHPVIWMFDDDIKEIAYSYNNESPIVEEEEGTYADPDANIKQKCISWNHSLAEVFQNIIDHGLRIDVFKEHFYAPYPFVRNTEEYEPGKHRIKHLGNKIPLVYSILATNEGDGRR